MPVPVFHEMKLLTLGKSLSSMQTAAISAASYFLTRWITLFEFPKPVSQSAITWNIDGFIHRGSSIEEVSHGKDVGIRESIAGRYLQTACPDSIET
jgi:hypothetical protein